MKNGVVLNEITGVRGIVNSFITTENELLLIEPECIRYCHYTDSIDYSALNVKKLLGYTIAAVLYQEPLTMIQYIFLLKQDGTLEIRNLQFNLIDSLQTGIKSYGSTHEVQFLFDEKFRCLYCNLEDDCLYMIQLQLKNKLLTFLHSKQTITAIQTVSSSIVSIDLTLDYDVYTNEELAIIALLSKDIKLNQYFFHAIYRKNSTTKNRKPLWEPLIRQKEITAIEDDFDNLKGNQALMKSIPHIGVFIFTPSRIIFLPLPLGFENIIAGNKISEEIYEWKGSIIEEQFKKNFEFQSILQSSIGLNSIDFKLVTKNMQLIDINLKKLMEDEEKYIIYWEDFKITKSSFIDIVENTNIKDERIEKLFFYKDFSTYLVQLKSDKLVLGSINNAQPLSATKYEQETYVTSFVAGINSKRIIRSGITNGGSCFVDEETPRYVNDFKLSELYSSRDGISRMWSTKEDKLYWYDTSMNSLYENGKIKQIEDAKSITHITNGGKLIFDKTIVVAINIWNDTIDSYCCLTTDGLIRWQLGTASRVFDLAQLNKNRLHNIKICSVKKGDGTNVTIYAIENEITIITNYGSEVETIRTHKELDSISSIFYHEVGRFSNILVSDIHGKVWIIDAISSKGLDVININFHSVAILGLRKCDNIVLYSKDNFVILRPIPSTQLHYEYIHLDLSLNIRKIVNSFGTDLNDTLILQTLDNKILKLNLEPNVPYNKRSFVRLYTDVLINKFIFLPCSTRYLIASYVKLSSDPQEHGLINSSGICVYDLYERNIVTKYNISSKYQQTTISDISEISYRKSISENFPQEKQISFAKQLILSQCFLVSLNYELSETDVGHKLLLFMFDDEKGTLDFQSGIDTHFSISSLCNYDENLFIAAGEYVQLFKLDYSVKEDIFRILSVSNKQKGSGYIKKLTELSYPNLSIESTNEHSHKKRKKDAVKKRIFIGLDLLRGFFEINLEIRDLSKNESITKPYAKYTFKPNTNSDSHPIISDTSNELIITDFAVNEVNGMIWYVLCCGANKIKLYFTPKTENDFDLIEFYLPKQVTGISSIYSDKKDESPNGRLLMNNSNIKHIFSITTVDNGHYMLSTLNNNYDETFASVMKLDDLNQHLKLIGATYEDDTDGEDKDSVEIVRLIDNRVWGNSEIQYI